MPDPIIVMGAGGHARAVAEAIRAQDCFRIAGLLDSFQPPGPSGFGPPVLGGESDLPALCREHGVKAGLIAIGDNWQRTEMARRIRIMIPDFTFITVIHPSAAVAPDAVIGAGTVILPGSVVVSGCRLGEGCIVNTMASLDHDGIMGDYSSLAPGAVTGGRVAIGPRSSIGLGARILQKVSVGADTVIGAGALVLEDMPGGVVAFGTPARVVRPRAADEPYL